jgi:dihydrofolate synthase/folylpolyglutamate synthase
LARFNHVILTRYTSNPRGVPLDELAAAATLLGATNVSLATTPADAWNAVRARAMPDDLVCITGSFYIAGEMRRELTDRPLRVSSSTSGESA